MNAAVDVDADAGGSAPAERFGDALAGGGRIVAGVPASAGEPASLAVFERDGDGFTCRRVLPMRLTPVQKGVARAL